MDFIHLDLSFDIYEISVDMILARWHHAKQQWHKVCTIHCSFFIQLMVKVQTVHFFWCVQVNGSLLPASVISLYCTYLCYSGISSEPRDYECNGLHNHSKAVSTGSLTLGLLTTVLSVVYSAVRAGSSTTLISPPSSPRAGQLSITSS